MITVTDRTGQQHELDGQPGRSLMLQLRPLKVGIVGLCNGNALCGTCHIYVRPDQLERTGHRKPLEDNLLEPLKTFRPESRLACQIVYSQELDGLELTVAPKS